MLSNKFDHTDNVYFNNKINVSFNNGVMGMFEKQHDGKVNKCIIDYAINHNRKDTLLYNNRLFFSCSKKTQVVKKQYETNRLWILSYFS